MKFKTGVLVATLLTTFIASGATQGASNVEPGEETISLLPKGFPAAKASPVSGEESAGPFKKLLIKGVNLIDGTGAPTQGPVDITIEGNRITKIVGGVMPDHLKPKQDLTGVQVIDAKGKFVIPGMIDTHVHFGSPYTALEGSLTDGEYINKLWLAHGVTTVRDAGAFMGLKYTLRNKHRSAKNEISAPRMMVHIKLPEYLKTGKQARKWVRAVAKKGADGLKISGGKPNMIAAAIDEAKKLGLKTMQHHSQTAVTRVNALDTARLGLDSVEHWYGVPEAMFEDRIVQDYPHDYNYMNEQDRFSQAGRLWRQAAAPGSKKWNETIAEMISLDLTMSPTLSIYEPNRDLMRAQNAPWHKDYSMPYIARGFEPNKHVHGAYFFNWTTAEEIAWKKNYQLWMTFLNDYKNKGGRVTTGSDPGFIYALYGFGYIRELEMLQEAGFHPLEAIQSATLNGAELLGLDSDLGSIEVGKIADLVIVNENPIANFKVLYGTGHEMLDFETNKKTKTKGIEYTIKDGIVYDAKRLLADVRQLVIEQREKEAAQTK